MPPDDQATRSAARCSTHPGRPSIAVCHACGRPLCLGCAVPIRGEVFGAECLGEVLGPDGTGPTAVPSPRPRDVPVDLVGVGFAAMVVASILPWTRFGAASGTFGGWGLSPVRWSSMATVAAVAGFVLWSVLRSVRRARRGLGMPVLFGLAVTAFAGALLHLLNPPPFTRAWLGPWVAAGSAAFTAFVCAWLIRQRGRGTSPLP